MRRLVTLQSSLVPIYWCAPLAPTGRSGQIPLTRSLAGFSGSVAIGLVAACASKSKDILPSACRFRIRNAFLFLILMTLLSVCAATGLAQAQRNSVLILFDENTDFPGLVLLDQTLRSTLKVGPPGQIDIYSEYMDLSRFSDENHKKRLFDYYRQKYQGKKIDLIFAVMGPSLNFMLEYGDELFPGTPIVFCGIDKREIEGRNLGPNVTGVLVRRVFKPTLELALRIHPDTRQVVLIRGTSDFGKYWGERAREELREFEGRVTITDLSPLSMNDIRQEVARLPPHTIILYLHMFRDGAGNSFQPNQALSLIAEEANAPIYVFLDQFIGKGAVGGHVYSMEAQGVKAGELGLRILSGESPANIAARDEGTNVYMFDWQQVRRWDIDESSLPPDSIVRFKQLTFWEQYKLRIVGIISLCILEALLIIWLLINRARRVQAQRTSEHFAELARAEHRRLDEVVSNVPGMVWEVRVDTASGKHETKFVSRFVERMLGYNAEDFLGTAGFGLSLVPEEDRERVERETNEILRAGTSGTIQYHCKTKEGQLLWVEEHLTAICDENGQPVGLRGVTMNISDRKQAEAALKKAMEEVSRLKNKLEEENIYLREEINLAHSFDEIVGRSDATKYVLFKIEQVARTDSSVLISGETGTGKELVARAIHSSGLRKDQPLVRVNCAALSPTLIESELFGHEKGAFTGATARKIGRFELANGATLFLDEIGEFPLELQAKLLRVLEEGEFERLGSSKTIKVDVRIIASTNRNLKIAVDKGTFREDLWYRLNVFPITVPPLRDRKEDVPDLVEHFVTKFSQKVGRQIYSIAPASLRTLQDYAWPGNVRELANVIERAVINTGGPVLRIVDHFEKSDEEERTQSVKTLEAMEKEYITCILHATGWRIDGPKGAAKILGLNASTLRTRMTKLGIRKPDGKSLASAV